MLSSTWGQRGGVLRYMQRCPSSFYTANTPTQASFCAKVHRVIFTNTLCLLKLMKQYRTWD